MCFIQNLNAKTNVANTDCNNSFCLFLLRPGNLKYFKSECHTLIASCLSEISWLWKCTWLCVTTSWTTTMCPRRCWPCTCRASLTPLLPSTSRPATTSGSTTARQQRYTHTCSCFMKNLSQKYLRNWWLKIQTFFPIHVCGYITMHQQVSIKIPTKKSQMFEQRNQQFTIL